MSNLLEDQQKRIEEIREKYLKKPTFLSELKEMLDSSLLIYMGGFLATIVMFFIVILDITSISEALGAKYDDIHTELMANNISSEKMYLLSQYSNIYFQSEALSLALIAAFYLLVSIMCLYLFMKHLDTRSLKNTLRVIDTRVYEIESNTYDLNLKLKSIEGELMLIRYSTEQINDQLYEDNMSQELESFDNEYPSAPEGQSSVKSDTQVNRQDTLNKDDIKKNNDEDQ